MSDHTTSVATVSVRLVGGPDDWHDKTLDGIYTAGDLAGSRDSLGTYLISSSVPAGHSDPGARAVYEPNDVPFPADVWFFRGWVPSSPADPERRTPEHLVDVEVSTVGGVPQEWVDADGAHYVLRILAHWQATGEDQLAPDVWHVATTRGADIALHRHIGDVWQAGPLPALQDQEEAL
ncbi:hypothetical protein [Nocardiopsis sp. RV163]|uniref:hypothetical protein n=1 Tax=Nocardiopsis sp. RV163 TaxID=1661388 RepID=UPI00064BC2FD|nr:hypothetical protein [Nocardiopsis sp. RV163]